MVIDFGLAKVLRTEPQSANLLTREGQFLGTPRYMSPEQIELPSDEIDTRADVYSLGVVLFELLTATRPFVATTPLALAMMHKSEAPPPPRSVRSDLPAWIERLVLRCLQKDPDKRFPRAEELAAELRRPHQAATPRRLPSGDVVIEDDAATGGWALQLTSEREKTGWTPGTVLHFYDRYYKLAQIDAPTASEPSWVYRFRPQPETEVIRRMVDYREDCLRREREKPASAWSKLSSKLFH